MCDAGLGGDSEEHRGDRSEDGDLVFKEDLVSTQFGAGLERTESTIQDFSHRADKHIRC